MIIGGIPAYNEAKYIKDIVTDVKKYVDEVIVVNDGSRDGTALLAEKAGAIVFNHAKNLGYGAAVITILEESRERNIDALVIIDADNQHYPSDIPHLVKPIFNGFDIVIGSRNGIDIPKFRWVGGKVLSIFTRILSGVYIKDSQSGFRAYSKKAIEVLEPKEKGMAISSEVVSLATLNKLRIIEVPISIRYTNDSSTHNPVVQGFYTLFRVLGMIVKRRILKWET